MTYETRQRLTVIILQLSLHICNYW